MIELLSEAYTKGVEDLFNWLSSKDCYIKNSKGEEIKDATIETRIDMKEYLEETRRRYIQSKIDNQ